MHVYELVFFYMIFILGINGTFSCLTTTERCNIPFSYKDRQFYDCTTFDNYGVPWCSTGELGPSGLATDPTWTGSQNWTGDPGPTREIPGTMGNKTWAVCETRYCDPIPQG